MRASGARSRRACQTRIGGQAAKAGLERGPGRRCSGGRTQVQVDGLEAEEVAFDVGCTMGAGPPNETKRGRR